MKASQNIWNNWLLCPAFLQLINYEYPISVALTKLCLLAINKWTMSLWVNFGYEQFIAALLKMII